MPGQGSGGNIVAAICSFFLPGLGQLVQGRILMAAVHFVLSVALWILSLGLFGWIMHIVSALGAARWAPQQQT